MRWTTTRFDIDLTRPRVMAIVNVTPDSFSDGGLAASTAAAILRCEQLVSEGAAMLDIGGESTRPGAAAVSASDEWARVGPVLQAALRLGVPVSVDTCKTEVMRRALDAGADIVNDIGALRAAGALAAVAAHPRAGVCLMHMAGEPSTMQDAPVYEDVVAEVRRFLAGRIAAAEAAGIGRGRLVADPGIGFGKTVEHNLALLRHQDELHPLGVPLLVGWSRKSTLGAVTGRAVGDRLGASLAAALAAVERGARVVRVHDVAATVDALKLWDAAALPAGGAHL